MKAFLFAAAVNFALLGVDALKIEKRSEPAILKLDLVKRSPNLSKRSLSVRAGEVSTPDINFQKSLLYIVQLEFGTPPQSQFVQLDTGSSDLFVETDSSTLCNPSSPYNPTPCTNFGAYDANSSSTYQYIDSNFIVSYGGGDGGTGDWVSDIVSIGGASVTGTQFGIQYKGDVLEGILGVSYQIIESRQTFSGEPQYDNFPVLLVKQGYIASRAFSLWTNDDQSTSGTLLFGGIDTDKFSGELVTIDLIASGFDNFPGVVDFTISLNGVTGTDSNGKPVAFANGATALNILLDSGTTYTLLEPTLVQSIWDFVGAVEYSNSPTAAYIDCSQASSTQTINFAFDGITIVVPLSQLVISQDATGQNCEFGIQKDTSDTSYIIGDTVLAAMYVVYDLDNNQVSLAPTVFNSATSNILQIMAGPGGVPDSTSATSSVSSGTTSSTTSSSSSSQSTSSTSSSSSSPTTSSTSSSSSSPSTSSTSSSSSSTSSSTSSPTTSTTSSSSSSKTTSSTSSSSSSKTSSTSKTTSTTSSTSSSKTSSTSKATSTTSSTSSSKTSSTSKTTSTTSSSSSSKTTSSTSSSSSSKTSSTSKTTSTTSSTSSSKTSSTSKTTSSTSTTQSTTLKTSTTSSTSSSQTPVPTVPVSPVAGFSYLGCYTDNLNNRALTGIEFANIGNHQVTNTNCITYCASNGYILAGTEYGGQCFCGNSFSPASGSTLEPNSQCTIVCEGNSTQICGDSVRLSVYQMN